MAFFGYKDIDKLSGVDLAIYRFIVEHDEQIPYMRVRELARGAHVSNSSVMRFIRKIGYDSFPEFKVSLRSETPIQKPDAPGIQFVQPSAFPADITKIIRLAAQLMVNADNIVFVGIGASAALGEYASRQTSSLGFNSYVVKRIISIHYYHNYVILVITFWWQCQSPVRRLSWLKCLMTL